ncbi:MAG: ABC transporter permease [Tidjanibacter sp.]|nr:ABC transporter permease [Tidjanibacter sp.]MBR1958544.1 ABC transporter permease [Tidjanibacter sp.]
MGKIKIIAEREFNERVRKKSFIITTILMPIAFVAIMFVPALMMNISSDEKKEIIVVDQSGMVGERLQDDGQMMFSLSDKGFDTLKEENNEVFGILVIGEDVATNPSNLQLFTYESSTINIESAITEQVRNIIEAEKLKQYNIDDLDRILGEIKTPVSLQVKQLNESGEAKDSSAILNIALAYVFGFLIYMFVFLYGNMVMQGVIEEKSSKVMEVMVSSVKPFQLMMGKILGIAAVAITQFMIWVVFILVVGAGAMSLLGGDELLAAAQASAAMDPAMASMSGAEISIDKDTAALINTITDPGYLVRILGGFLLYFVGGYLLYAAMFAAVGSAVDNEKDTNNLQLPITIPLILALFVMMSAMQEPNGPLAVWFSMIPFTSPIVMMVRLPYGVPDGFWISVLLLYGTFLAMVWLAGKIYRVGVFMYGKKPTLGELLKWARYKS